MQARIQVSLITAISNSMRAFGSSENNRPLYFYML